MTVRIVPLRGLDAETERLLRERAALHGRDSERSVEQMQNALATERISAAVLLNDQAAALGLVAWRWPDRAQSLAQVLILYAHPESPPAVGAALVKHVFTVASSAPITQVIEARLRDETPGVREAWQARSLAIFERCRLHRPLGNTPLPVMPVPASYQIVDWHEDRMPGIESVVVAAYTDSIELAAVPDVNGSVVDKLHQQIDGVGWYTAASLVALDKREQVVGYVVFTQSEDETVIVDLAVHPDHRRRGLARALLIRSLQVCVKHSVSDITVTVTTRNPARQLYNQLGFLLANCAAVAIWWRDGRHTPWI